MTRFKFLQKSKINKLPKTAGVYAFAGSDPAILYIGKAINIQGRVKNHFQQPSYHDNLFMDKVDKVGFFETNNSEIEALILEANLIKKYQPKFNVVWKDGKNYFYVAIACLPASRRKTSQAIPYICITHQPKTGRHPMSTQYIGPFVEGTALKKTLKYLRRAFPYYTTDNHSKMKCTWCHLYLCPGPAPDLQEYKKNVKKLILVLQGKRNAVLNSLKKEMRDASKKQDFEKAGKIRDKIYALQQVMSHARVIGCINAPTSDVGQFATRSKNHAIVDFLLTLGLKNKVYRIECYDVSNIQGKQATGSMVVFSAKGGPASGWMPDKSQYRKFKIRIKNTPDDIAMLKEVLTRRFEHSEWPMPDAILIDGGKAQLNAAINSKKESITLSMRSHLQGIRVLSIAKGKQELFIEGRKEPIPLKQLPQEIYNLVKQLDDEAHRFAISYHKKLRKKNLLI